MKNVIVFALGASRFGIELRWVREVFTLGPVTRVPTAPDVVAGAVNVHGGIVPVLHTPPLVRATLGITARPVRAPQQGESAILLDVDDVRFALTVDRIDEVTTLYGSDSDGALRDARGRAVSLLRPPALLDWARARVNEAAHAHAPR